MVLLFDHSNFTPEIDEVSHISACLDDNELGGAAGVPGFAKLLTTFPTKDSETPRELLFFVSFQATARYVQCFATMQDFGRYTKWRSYDPACHRLANFYRCCRMSNGHKFSWLDP